ncbi:SGNH/GDSL hydrolase family protein [Rhizobium subbaraonis]|nr:SGNH/GDSL hydrolase family protein [Rhizobium subbaraonis]
MTITDQAKIVYAAGSSSSPAEPDKSQIIALFKMIDALLSSALNGVLIGNAVVYATRSALYADLAHPANRLGIVYNDPTAGYNGIYIKAGSSGSGSWSITSLALPATFAADLSAVIAEVATARGAEVSLVARLSAIVTSITTGDNAVRTTLAAATTPVVDFGQELLYDESGVAGPEKTLYVPRELFARAGGSTALNGSFGTASTPFPNHVAFTITSGSDIATVYVDANDDTNPVKIALVPSGVVQNIAARYFIVAEIWRGVVKSPFPVMRLDENLKSRIQFRYPIAILGDKIRFSAFYHYTRRTGFTLYSPASGDLYWEFDLSTATNSETRYYFDPVAAAAGSAPIKAVSGNAFPMFPRDDRFVFIAASLARSVRTDHQTVGARPGSRHLSMFSRGNDPDRSTLFSANALLADFTSSELTSRGIVRGVTGIEAFYGEDLPPDMPLEGWYFVRCYVHTPVVDPETGEGVYYTPRLYFLDAGGNALTTEGGANSYFGLAKEKRLSVDTAIFVGFARYKFTSRPVRYNIGAYQDPGTMCTFGGAQLYAGVNIGGYIFPEEWPTPSDMDALYGGKHYSIAGRPLPFFVPSMLSGKRNVSTLPLLTIRCAASADADTPYFLSGAGTLELDYARAGSSMLFETQGGPEGAGRRARRTVANARVSAPVAGSAAILGFGDSIGNRSVLGKASAKMSAVGISPTFIGSIQQNDGLMGECREGWEWQDFYHGETQFPPVTNVAAYLALAADGTGSDRRQGHNPWVRPATGGDPVGKVFYGHIFDFAWGLSRLGLALPTHVMINFGTNDINQRSPAMSLAQAKTGLGILVSSIRAAGANIQIGVGLPAIPRSASSDQKWVEEQVPMIRAIIDYVRTLADDKVNVLPFWAHMSTDTDWVETTLFVDENATVARVSDELHPNEQNRHMMAEVIAAWVANTI